MGQNLPATHKDSFAKKTVERSANPRWLCENSCEALTSPGSYLAQSKNQALLDMSQQ